MQIIWTGFLIACCWILWKIWKRAIKSGRRTNYNSSCICANFWILMNRYFHSHQENHLKWWNILQFSLTTIIEQFFMDTNRKIRLWLLFQLLLVNGYFKPRRRLYFNSWAEPWTKKSVKFLYQNRNIKTWPKLRKLQSIFLLISSFFRVVFVEKSAQWSAWVLKIII